MYCTHFAQIAVIPDNREQMWPMSRSENQNKITADQQIQINVALKQTNHLWSNIQTQ